MTLSVCSPEQSVLHWRMSPGPSCQAVGEEDEEQKEETGIWRSWRIFGTKWKQARREGCKEVKKAMPGGKAAPGPLACQPGP